VATERPRVLFLCTGNSCRSQMAEGWARAIHGGTIEAVSAGTAPSTLNRLAVRAMAEAGIDISNHRSKRVEELRDSGPIDLVVTVCDSAHGSCPAFPGATPVVHVGFDDPPHLARHAANDDEALPHYRRVRDEIREFIRTLPALVAKATRGSVESSIDATLRGPQKAP
jgi:arsenate reductase